METIMNGLNLYPHSISLKHKKKNFFYSSFGFILSLITYGIIILLVNYYSYDFYNKTNPKINFSQFQINESHEVSVNKLINSITLDLEIKFNIFKNYTNDPLKLFDESLRFGLQNHDRIKNYDIYYIDKGNTSIINLSDFNYSIKIQFEIRDKTLLKFSSFNGSSEISENITKQLQDININLKNKILKIFYEFKKPKAIINYVITKADRSFNMMEITLDTANYQNYTNMSIRNTKLKKGDSAFFIYKMVELLTDDNPYLNQVNNNIGLIPQVDFYYSFLSQKQFLDTYYENLMIIEFRNLMDQYSRVYKKIMDVLSELGGIFNPILIIGKFLVFNFNDKKYKLDILNQLFTEEDIQRDLKKNENKLDNEQIISKKLIVLKKPDLFYKETVNFDKKNKFTSNFTQGFYDKSENNIDVEMINYSNESRINVVQKTNETKIRFKRENNKIKNLIELFEDKNISKVKNNNQNYNLFQIDHFLIPNKNDDKNNFIQKEKKKKFTQDSFMKENNNFIFNKLNKIQNKNLLEEDDIRKKITEYLLMEKERKNKLLRYSFKEVIQSVFCQRKLSKNLKEKEEIYIKIVEKLNFYLEITNMMKLYENFEKMKFFFLNKNQKNLFNYMIHEFDFYKNENEENVLYELCQYFKKTKSNYFEKKNEKSIKIRLKNDIINLLEK